MTQAPFVPQIYQIFYKTEQRPYLEKEFIPYDNIANPRPEWCEYHVFREAYLKGLCSCGPTGFLSWKFHEKTGLNGQAFHELINRNPGFDVYFINPFVDEAALYLNIWLQGEKNHPGLIELTQKIFNRVGYKLDLASTPMPVEKTLFCNYFVATPKFWQAYMEFCEPIYNEIENGLDAETKAFLASRADAVIKADYRPFIFERLFSTFLLQHPQLKAKNFSWNHTDLQNRYRGLAPTIEKLSHLKSKHDFKASDQEFSQIASEAQRHPDYGPNASWTKKKIRELLNQSLFKIPFVKDGAKAIRRALN